MLQSFRLAAALALLASAAFAQFGPGVTPTNDGTHGVMASLGAAAASVGMDVGAVGGQEGSTTVGGFAAWEYSAADLGDVNVAGMCSANGPPFTIAFDTDHWTAGAIGPPPDWGVVAEFAGVAYHEQAHAVYEIWYDDWATQNPGAWAAFRECLNDHHFSGNPCGEAYSSSASISNLCADKMALCDADWLDDQVQKDLLAGIDAWIANELSRCDLESFFCFICSGPMPPGWESCPDDCPCPEN
jgi:hypothetical protein